MVAEIITKPHVVMHQLPSNNAKDDSKIMWVVCKSINIPQILHGLVERYKTTMPLLPRYILLVLFFVPIITFKSKSNIQGNILMNSKKYYKFSILDLRSNIIEYGIKNVSSKAISTTTSYYYKTIHQSLIMNSNEHQPCDILPHEIQLGIFLVDMVEQLQLHI